MNNFKKYFGILALVVFCAGFLIYTWRGLHGENLAKPPQFDLSIYQNTTWYTQSMKQDYDRFIKPTSDAALSQTEQKISSSADSSKAKGGFIYFKKSFCDFAGDQALSLIENFLGQFDGLKQRPIEFISGSTEFCAKVNLIDVDKAENVMEKIQKDYSDFVVVK